MEAAVSLFWIALVAVASPLLSALVPRRLVPETVLLLAFGVVIGPHALGIATTGEAAEAFRELGLGMLFLLAGYEIELKELTGRGGRLSTPFGATILNHGAFGELGPVIATAVLLGTRGAFTSILVLGLFAVLAVGVTYA